jgi:ybaK/ebsC protein
MKIQKTNAARLLDREKIEYTLVPYQVDEEHLDAIHVAGQLGEDISMVFKTLVLKGDRTGHFVCVIPGDKEVDLKMAAKASGNKSCNLIHMKELLPTTGYIRGGCSPIGMKKQFPTFLHETAILYDTVCVSAGKVGYQIELKPDDLVSASGCRLEDLV